MNRHAKKAKAHLKRMGYAEGGGVDIDLAPGGKDIQVSGGAGPNERRRELAGSARSTDQMMVGGGKDINAEYAKMYGPYRGGEKTSDKELVRRGRHAVKSLNNRIDLGKSADEPLKRGGKVK